MFENTYYYKRNLRKQCDKCGVYHQQIVKYVQIIKGIREKKMCESYPD